MSKDIFQLAVYRSETVLEAIDLILGLVSPVSSRSYRKHSKKDRFFAFLNDAMKVPVPFQEGNAEPLLLAGPRNDDEARLFALLMDKESEAGTVEDIQTYLYTGTEFTTCKAKINAALEFISERYPDTFRGISALVGSFIFGRAKGFGGGTASNAIGVIWCGMQNPDVDTNEYVELILHEYMHQCLFLDDLCRRIFSYSMKELENYPTRSAILNRVRPLDKAYHSVFVAYILMRHRQVTSGQPLEYMKTTWAAIEGVAQNAVGLTEHGRSRLAELSTALRLIGTKEVAA